MRIVHIENYFDPQAGYQINELLYASKNFNDEVFIITSKDLKRYHKEYNPAIDREFERKTGVKIIRLNTLLKISSRIALKKLDFTIEKLNPDILFMHGIGDFRDLLLWKKKRSYKVVRDCHMSWVASRNKFKKIFYLFFKVFFSSIINSTNKYEKVYALGTEEYEYLRKIGINDNKIELLLHGYNNEVIYYDENERKSIREKYNFKDEDVVISYIGKFNDLKKPDLVFDIVKELGSEYIKNKNLKLLFIGPKEASYMQKFQDKYSDSINEIPIIIDDSKEFKELRKYYSASDICVFPKQTSLSSIHAQVCLCPVLMENHTSNKERVINKNHLYSINDFSRAADILREIIDNKQYIKGVRLIENPIEKREYKNQVKQVRSLVSN